MAKKKKDNDRRVVEEEYTVYAEVLAEATLGLTQAWNIIRDFEEDASRELTEREVVHLRASLYMTKEIFEAISNIAVSYNFMYSKEIKNKKVVPFRTGAIDVHSKEKKDL